MVTIAFAMVRESSSACVRAQAQTLHASVMEVVNGSAKTLISAATINLAQHNIIPAIANGFAALTPYRQWGAVTWSVAIPVHRLNVRVRTAIVA